MDEGGITKACGCPLLPLKSHIKGPAPASDQGRTDIVDEAITFFRANVFFRNFDIKSPADKLLIYLTFYINVALKRLEGCRTLAEGTKAIINLGLEKVPVPGESGFPFPGLFSLPQSQREGGNQYQSLFYSTYGIPNCSYEWYFFGFLSLCSIWSELDNKRSMLSCSFISTKNWSYWKLLLDSFALK